MDLSRTVFILGAGSSYPYGFPLGNQLKADLMNYSGTHSHSLIIDNFKEYMLKVDPTFKKELDNFCNSLKTSGSASIDTYLQQYQKDGHHFSDIGKILIGLFISRNSLTDAVRSTNVDDPWIEYFIKRFISYNRENFCEKHPKIISFNYDQLFEYKIEKNFKEETNKKIKSPLKTHHVYGSVTREASEENFPIPRDNDEQSQQLFNLKCEDIRMCSEHINLIRKENDVSLFHEFESAETIVILGYGFDPYNNKILFKNHDELSYLINTKNVYATGKGLNNDLIENINSLSEKRKKIVVYKDYNCTQLLEKIFPPSIFPDER